MKRLPRRTGPLDNRGVTIIEMMLTVAVMAVLFPAIITFFFYFSDSMAFLEASDNLKKENQETIDAIYARVLQNKRLYQNDSNGIAMLARLSWSGIYGSKTVSGSAVSFADPFPTIANSKLPLVCDTCRYNDADGSANTTNASGAMGNILFLLTQEPRIICDNVTASSGTRTVQVDIYKLRCFYLCPVNPNPVNDAGRVLPSRLVEWVSAPLADYNMIDYLYSQDATLAKNVVARLASPTTASVIQQGVTFAIDPTADTAATSLYKLTSGATPPYAVDATSSIPKDYPVTHVMGAKNYVKDANPGINVWTHLETRGSGRVYPNAIAGNDGKLNVPRYSHVDGDFPGGFEVGIAGPDSGRQVLVRVVHLAKTLKRVASIDQFQIMGCKDNH